MRLKMTRDQHEAIYNLYKTIVLPEKPSNDAERLIYSFMEDIYERMRKKEKAKFPKDWHLTLNPKEILAYKIYWQQKYIEGNLIYETHIINRQLAQIDQQAA